jgi:CRP-like cAMP-binding protein
LGHQVIDEGTRTEPSRSQTWAIYPAFSGRLHHADQRFRRTSTKLRSTGGYRAGRQQAQGRAPDPLGLGLPLQATGRRPAPDRFISLPGVICDLNVFILREMAHSIGTITPVAIANLSRNFFDEIGAGYPRIATAFWWESLVNSAIQREWTTSLGQRTASERMAHLLCEIFFRLRLAGLTQGDGCDFPLTQADLAEAMGLSKVHVNRTLQELRSSGLVYLKGKFLRILNLKLLMSAGLFNANYLHMEHEGRQLDSNE